MNELRKSNGNVCPPKVYVKKSDVSRNVKYLPDQNDNANFNKRNYADRNAYFNKNRENSNHSFKSYLICGILIVGVIIIFISCVNSTAEYEGWMKNELANKQSATIKNLEKYLNGATVESASIIECDLESKAVMIVSFLFWM